MKSIRIVALVMIIMSIGLIIYNLTHLNLSDSLTSVPNQQVYMNLVGNVLILISLVLSCITLGKSNKNQLQQ